MRGSRLMPFVGMLAASSLFMSSTGAVAAASTSAIPAINPWAALTAMSGGAPAATLCGSAATVAAATQAPSGSHDGRGSRSGIPTPTPPAPAPFVIHCRHGAPSACDLDERDGDGATLLHGLAWAGRLDEVQALLEAGADPNATKGPAGPTPMDIVLRQVMAGYDSAAKAAQVVDALAASPRATLSAALKEDLAADPSTWRLVGAGPARERLLRHREALLRLPARAPDPKPDARAGPRVLMREGPCGYVARAVPRAPRDSEVERARALELVVLFSAA